MQNPNRTFQQILCPNIYHFNLGHEHYDSHPHKKSVYVQNVRENLMKTSEKWSGKGKKEKAFKIVFETLLTSTTPKHVFNSTNLRNIYEKLFDLHESYKNKCACDVGWKEGEEKKELWTRPSINRRRKNAFVQRQYCKIVSDKRYKRYVYSNETWLIWFLFVLRCLQQIGNLLVTHFLYRFQDILSIQKPRGAFFMVQ